MRAFVRAGFVFAVVLGLAAPAPAEQTNKPSSSVPLTVAPAGGGVVKVPQPDFHGFADGQYVFVMNGGEKDYTGPLDIRAKCKSTAPNPPANACGPNFPLGSFTHHEDHFEAGHGPAVAPIKGSGNAQQVSGYGWQAYFMGLPPGTYEITLAIDPMNKVAEGNEGNNISTKTITIQAPPPPGGVIKVNPTVVPVRVN